MPPITIICGACQGVFQFRHPAIQEASRLNGVTLTCPHCECRLKSATDKLFMTPVDGQLRQLKIVDRPSEPEARDLTKAIRPLPTKMNGQFIKPGKSPIRPDGGIG